jgi:tetratricopeptide (TPR) repeat protein
MYTSQDPRVARIGNNLAVVLAVSGALEESQALHQKLLDLRKNLFHGDHADVAVSLTQLGLVTAALGDLATAETRLHEALAMQSRLGMDTHTDRADALLDLGMVLIKKGDFVSAETNLLEAKRLREINYRQDNSELSEPLDALALIKVGDGDPEAAEKLSQDALRLKKANLPSDAPDLIPFLFHLSWIENSLHRTAETNQPLHDQAVAIARQHGLCGTQAASDALCDMADVLRVRGKYVQAEPLLVEAEVLCQGVAPMQSPIHRHSVAHLARFYEIWNAAEPGNDKAAKAAEWKQKLSALEKAGPHETSASR